MPDPVFPPNIKPIVTEYSFNMPDNVLEHPVSGGSNLQILDTKFGRSPFQVTIIGTPLKMQVFNDFYYGKIDGGSAKFIMELDSGNGLEDHTVLIQPSTIRQSFANDPTRIISFIVWAEKTPFQDDPFGGGLSDLYEVFGEDLTAVLSRLAIYANEDIPEFLG